MHSVCFIYIFLTRLSIPVIFLISNQSCKYFGVSLYQRRISRYLIPSKSQVLIYAAILYGKRGRGQTIQYHRVSQNQTGKQATERKLPQNNLSKIRSARQAGIDIAEILQRTDSCSAFSSWK